MAVLAFSMTLAHVNARPERREIKKATLEHSVENLCGCISVYNASCRRKPPHSAESAAGNAMGLAEADLRGGAGRSKAQRVLTSSSRISEGDEGRGSLGVTVWVQSSVTNLARRNR